MNKGSFDQTYTTGFTKVKVLTISMTNLLNLFPYVYTASKSLKTFFYFLVTKVLICMMLFQAHSQLMSFTAATILQLGHIQ
jgi:hypothetical protein